MGDETRELEELRQTVAELSTRLHRLERLTGYGPPRPRPATGTAVAAPTAAVPARDLESKIGSHWLNRVGIIAVLVGVSYFLKYAFDNNWVGAPVRVVIGLAFGIGILTWSERFRRHGYRVFSYSLKAIGIGILYLSLWAGFQLYHLVPGALTAAAMILVTLGTAVLAIKEDAEVLGTFSLAGGFATPLLLSTGQNQEVAVFSYLALLNLATVMLVAFRPWKRLLIAAFVGTLAMYVSWYSSHYTPDQLYRTIFFTTVFFLTFAAVPVLVRRRAEARPRGLFGMLFTIVVILALVNGGAYFFEVFFMLAAVSMETVAWIAVGVAGVYIALSAMLHSHAAGATGEPRVIAVLHLAVAVGALTLAIALRLHAYWITIGWFLEAAALWWVAHRIGIRWLRVLATAVLVLGALRLLAVDRFDTVRLLLNARFATYLVAIAVLAGIVTFGRAQGLSRRALAVAVISINVLALLALTLEAHAFFAQQIAAMHLGPFAQEDAPTLWEQYRRLIVARGFAFSAIWMIYGGALMAFGFWKHMRLLRWQAITLIAVTIVKVFTYDVSTLDRAYRVASFIVLGVLLLVISFAYQRAWLKFTRTKQPETALAHHSG